jgi:membrane-associated phospholipid phosphatase
MLAVIGFGLGPFWFGVILLVWAVLVSLARVGMGVHYLSDVTAGGIIGLLMGWVTLFLYNRYEWVWVIFTSYLSWH